jgi:uncharacterized protein
MQSPKGPLRTRLLHGLAQSVYEHPRLFFYPQWILVILAVLCTVFFLDFRSDRNDLVGADKEYHQHFLNFLEEFGGQDDLIAVIESDNPEKNRQFVERLGARMEREPELFKDVFFKGDLPMLGRKALFFLPEEALVDLHQTLKDYRPFLESFADATNLNSLFRQVNRQFRAAQRQTPEDVETLIQALPALTRIVEQATATLRRPGIPPSPGMGALFNAGQEAEQEQYITFGGGRIYLATAHAAGRETSQETVGRLRELVAETQREVVGVNVGITGETILEQDEMLQSQRDSIRASIIALILVALVFVVAYREIGRPLKAVLALMVGLGYTMGYTTLAVGHLNILTVTFLPILIGLAIDFGVHLITRYEEELRQNKSEREALELSMVHTGMGIFTGCFTTAGAFFAMGLTDFQGIQEMGIITGGGMLVCLVPMLTLLPVMLLRGGRSLLEHSHALRVQRRAKIERLWLDRPYGVMAVTVLFCGLCLSQFPKVYFDYNLLNMQSPRLRSVVFEKKLIESAEHSVLFAAVVADSLEEAIDLERRLLELPTVIHVESMSRFLGMDQTHKIDLIRQIREEASQIEFQEPDLSLVDLPNLRQSLFYTRSYLGLAISELESEPDQKEVLKEILALRDAINEFLRFRKGEAAAQKLAAYQQALFHDIRNTFATLARQDIGSPLTIEDLPDPLKNRFVGATGKFLLQVYPRENLWERENQEEFIEEIRRIDPDVTGTPVQLYEYTTLLRRSYENAALYALAAIGLLVFLHFRSIANVVLALLPVAIGVTWMAGIMGFLGVPFNPANIMTLPLVIGIGVTNGIHILNRFAEEQNPGILAKSTGKAVLVSGLTTIAGFGSLIQAEHQGISSLGIVMVIGVAACMIAALTFLPALLNLLIRLGWKFKKPSGDNALSTLGREEPR